MNSGIYKQGGIRVMKDCFSYFGKEPLPDKPASDSQHSQETKKSQIPSWLQPKEHQEQQSPLKKSASDSQLDRRATQRFSNASKSQSTDLTEYKDEAETSHGQNTEHDMHWKIELEDVSTSGQPSEVKELVSKINNAMQELRKELNESNLPKDTVQEYMENILSNIRLTIPIPIFESKKNEARPLTKDLDHYLNRIQQMTKVVSNIRTGLRSIRESFTTGNVPQKLRDIINEDLTNHIFNIHLLRGRVKWKEWKQLSNEIEQTKILLKLLNEKTEETVVSRSSGDGECQGPQEADPSRDTLSLPTLTRETTEELGRTFATEDIPKSPQENNEPQHLIEWAKRLQKQGKKRKRNLWKKGLRRLDNVRLTCIKQFII
jgi:hypothetical protein